MDIRIQKTRQAIRQAFVQLRQEKQLEQITVKELAMLARISKATFYLHYRDIFDLNEQLQQEVIRQVVDSLSSPMTALEDFASFSRQLIAAVEKNWEECACLFSNTQMAALPIQLEAQLKEAIFARFPEKREDKRLNVQLSFYIQGGYYAYMENVAQLGDKQTMSFLEEIYEQVPGLKKE